ncbi:MAG: hypothetical protein IKF14_01585 [Atopobiaceae bacterium]|nr:hypothetical protein [Atopobiaceae bacterium]
MDLSGKAQSIRFSSEDLFVLLSGFDIALFCCEPSMVEHHIGRERRVLDEWRRKLVRKHKASGLVDAEGNPSPALKKTLVPLMSPGIYVSDADSPIDGNADERQACVYVYDDFSTLVERRRGLYGGWSLTSLQSKDQLVDAVLSLHKVSSRFITSAPDEHIVVPDDSDGAWIRAALQGDDDYLVSVAERFNFDISRILKVGSWWQQEGLAAQNRWGDRDEKPMLEYSTQDFRGCTYGTLGGIRTATPTSGPLRTRMTRLFPTMGFAFSIERSPRAQDPDDWWEHDELRKTGQFVTGDFIANEIRLVEILLSVDDNPNSQQ